MKQLPYDPVILLSYINTQLRDFYPSFEELCDSLDLDNRLISDKLALIDYHYDSDKNQFV